jgi:hypothetical protein
VQQGECPRQLSPALGAAPGRSLAATLPFTTARENLLLVFERNRGRYASLVEKAGVAHGSEAKRASSLQSQVGARCCCRCCCMHAGRCYRCWPAGLLPSCWPAVAWMQGAACKAQGS